jgi:hypothetical protein
MPEVDVGALTRQVLWAAFGLGAAFGAIAQRTQFCTMGAVSDIVNFGDWTRMRMWLLAIAVAMLGFNAMAGGGWIEAGNSFYTTPRMVWLSNALGGLMFGFGMVLAGGCGSKALVRLGSGSLKALVVFLVLGFSAYATLRGVAAVWRVLTVDAVAVTFAAGQDLPAIVAKLSGASRSTSALWVGGSIGLALLGFCLARPEGRSRDVLLAGLGLGAVIAGTWWVSGRLGHLAEHPQTLEEVFVATNSRRMESLTFVAPIAYTIDWLILFSDTGKVLTIGIASTAGVVVGSAIVALATRRFHWEGFAGTEDTALHIGGAALMGVGGVTAVGCTVGQGLSGLSTLALGSVVAWLAIIGGAVLALRWQAWRLERAGE